MPAAPTHTLSDVYALLRKACAEAGGQSAFAAAHGLTPSIVSDALNARRDPGPALLAALGLRRVTRFVPTKQAEVA